MIMIMTQKYDQCKVRFNKRTVVTIMIGQVMNLIMIDNNEFTGRRLDLLFSVLGWQTT